MSETERQGQKEMSKTKRERQRDEVREKGEMSETERKAKRWGRRFRQREKQPNCVICEKSGGDFIPN